MTTTPTTDPILDELRRTRRALALALEVIDDTGARLPVALRAALRELQAAERRKAQ